VTAGLALTVVGPAAAYALRAGWPSSCYLVESGDEAIVLDLGQGSFGALAALRDPATIAGVWISHLHTDHMIDLVPLRHYLRFGSHRPATVQLHAPGDIRHRFDVLFGEHGFLDDLPGPELVKGERSLGPFTVRAARVTHTENSVCLRVATASGPGLVYSGDCGEPDDLLALLRPGDTLLAEASFGAGPSIPGVAHLTAEQAGRAAADGHAGRLILTHILPEADLATAVDGARRVFGGEVVLAEPGLRVAIG
jgi:ribonuclease BN (tRNA processing enzyme)